MISRAHILPLALTTPKRFPQVDLSWLLYSMATDTSHDTYIYTIACINHIRRAFSHYTLHVEISSIYWGRAKIQLLLCLIASSKHVLLNRMRRRQGLIGPHERTHLRIRPGNCDTMVTLSSHE